MSKPGETNKMSEKPIKEKVAEIVTWYRADPIATIDEITSLIQAEKRKEREEILDEVMKCLPSYPADKYADNAHAQGSTDAIDFMKSKLEELRKEQE